MKRRRATWFLAVLAATLALPRAARAQNMDTPAPPPLGPAPEVRERATLLAAHLPDEIKLETVPPALLWIGAATGAGATVLLAVLPSQDTAGKALSIAAPATYLTADVAALLAPGEYQHSIAMAGLFLGTGSLWASTGRIDPQSDIRAVTPVALSAGYYASGALQLLSLALSRPAPLSRLREDYAAIRTPAGRARSTSGSVDAIERDFARSDPAIPGWLVAAPIIAGGLVATAPAFDGNVPDSDRALDGAIGGTTALFGLLLASAPEPYSQYVDQLGRAGLRVAAAPMSTGGAALIVSGRF